MRLGLGVGERAQSAPSFGQEGYHALHAAVGLSSLSHRTAAHTRVRTEGVAQRIMKHVRDGRAHGLRRAQVDQAREQRPEERVRRGVSQRIHLNRVRRRRLAEDAGLS